MKNLEIELSFTRSKNNNYFDIINEVFGGGKWQSVNYEKNTNLLWIVAHRHGELVGLTQIQIQDKKVHLNYCWVKEKYRRTNINYTMYEGVKTYCKMKRLKLVTAHIRKSNKGSLSSFTKMGFDIKTFIGKYKNGDNRVLVEHKFK